VNPLRALSLHLTNAKLLSQNHLGKIVIYEHYAIFPSELQAVFKKK
jgi:hypothetical protein